MPTLGAKYNPQANTISFRVFSQNATRIAICFYPVPLDADEVFIMPLVRQGDIWEISLALDELQEAGSNSGRLYYGYRAWGPNWEY
ncbi:MAG TPA: glycogen-debranching protein, partial [Bacillota bacterium]|nr:glycogen-debranching protein [Bacillota bacterium]